MHPKKVSYTDELKGGQKLFAQFQKTQMKDNTIINNFKKGGLELCFVVKLKNKEEELKGTEINPKIKKDMA